MRPSEVLDHQAALVDYLGSIPYRDYMRNFVQDMIDKGKVEAHSGIDLAGTLQRSMKIAEAFHVQPEMESVLRSASMDLDDTDYLVHENLPAEHGFLVFDNGWVSEDVWGTPMVCSAFQWFHSSAQMGSKVLPGIWVIQYSDLNDERDEVTQNLVREKGYETVSRLGRLHVNHVWFLAYGEEVGPFAEPTPEDYAQFAMGGQVMQSTTPNHGRMVVAMFRLLRQVFVEIVDAPLDRSSLRRAKRANLPQRVQVIKLRRKERKYLHPSDAPTNVEWKHQWPVRGHWAWRNCGANHPVGAEPYEKGYRVRVYIKPFWKGPENMPVLATAKVWDLSR